MAYLLRKVSFNKWNFGYTNHDSIPADTLGDLKTTQSKLSAYILETNNEEAIKDIIVGMSFKSRAEKFGYFLIKIDDLKTHGFSYIQSKGKTDYLPADEKHVDISVSTAKELLDFVKLLKNYDIDTHTKAQVSDTVLKAVQESKLQEDQLHKDFKKKLSKML